MRPIPDWQGILRPAAERPTLKGTELLTTPVEAQVKGRRVQKEEKNLLGVNRRLWKRRMKQRGVTWGFVELRWSWKAAPSQASSMSRSVEAA